MLSPRKCDVNPSILQSMVHYIREVAGTRESHVHREANLLRKLLLEKKYVYADMTREYVMKKSTCNVSR